MFFEVQKQRGKSNIFHNHLHSLNRIHGRWQFTHGRNCPDINRNVAGYATRQEDYLPIHGPLRM